MSFGSGGPQFFVGHDGVFEGVVAGPARFGRDLGDDAHDDGLGLAGVFGQVGNDHVHRDVVLIAFPAVVVGDHGHCGIGDFGFACAFGFAEVGHADDVVAEIVIGEGLGAGAEGGAFHVDVSAAVVDAGAFGLGALEQQLAQFGAYRVGKGDVGDDAAAEEGVFGGSLGAVEELVRENDVAGVVFILE